MEQQDVPVRPMFILWLPGEWVDPLAETRVLPKLRRPAPPCDREESATPIEEEADHG